MERETGLEPVALCLGSRCSTTELRPLPTDLVSAAYTAVLRLSTFSMPGPAPLQTVPVRPEGNGPEIPSAPLTDEDSRFSGGRPPRGSWRGRDGRTASAAPPGAAGQEKSEPISRPSNRLALSRGGRGCFRTA